MAELRRSPPSSIEELMETVTEYSESIEEDEVKKAVGNIVKRAQFCVEAKGGAFEHKLKKSSRGRGVRNEE